MKTKVILLSTVVAVSLLTAAQAAPINPHAVANNVAHASDLGVSHASDQGLVHSNSHGLGQSSGNTGGSNSSSTAAGKSSRHIYRRMLRGTLIAVAVTYVAFKVYENVVECNAGRTEGRDCKGTAIDYFQQFGSN